MRGTACFKLKCMLTAVAVLATELTATSEPSKPLQIERVEIFTDKKGIAKGLHIEFVLMANYVLSQAYIAYRRPPAGQFTEARLKRSPRLRYTATIPCSEPCSGKVEYYVRMRPERGADVIVGSSEKPLEVDCSGLKRVEREQSAKSAILAITLSIILSIIGVGIAKARK